MASKIAHRTGHIAEIDPRIGRGPARFEILRVERTEPNANFRRTTVIASGRTALGRRLEIRIGINQQSLAGCDFSGLGQCVIVVGTDPEDLLVQSSGLRQETLPLQMVRNSHELFDRLVVLSGADVQITQDIRRRPIFWLLVDDASVFRDGRFQLALLEQLLGTSQDGGTIYGHGDEASTELVDGIKQRRRPKRTPVRVRVAEPCDSLEMIGRCVPLMAVETVPWILCMKLLHETIAGNLGHDGGRSNGRTPSIAMGHSALRHRYIGHAKRVDEHDIRQAERAKESRVASLVETPDEC